MSQPPSSFDPGCSACREGAPLFPPHILKQAGFDPSDHHHYPLVGNRDGSQGRLMPGELPDADVIGMLARIKQILDQRENDPEQTDRAAVVLANTLSPAEEEQARRLLG